MSPSDLFALVEIRVSEAERRLGRPLVVTWDIGPYAHFEKARGFGVTFIADDTTCKMRFSKKLLRSSLSRVDAIIRHEIGHVVDAQVSPHLLDRWAAKHGVKLPSTVERRADAIALVLWQEPILYDADDVQSMDDGVWPRPAYLGA